MACFLVYTFSILSAHINLLGPVLSCGRHILHVYDMSVALFSFQHSMCLIFFCMCVHQRLVQ